MSYHNDKIEITKIVSYELNRVMAERNVTAGELSEHIGVPVSIVDKFMSGEKLPCVTRLYRICRALNCSVSELLRDDVDL